MWKKMMENRDLLENNLCGIQEEGLQIYGMKTGKNFVLYIKTLSVILDMKCRI